MNLNVDQLNYLISKQKQLDNSIREKHFISLPKWKDLEREKSIAFSVEIHEFLNEVYKPWKYWKKKDMDRDAILEEAVDVLHFAIILIIDGKLTSDFVCGVLHAEYHNLKGLTDIQLSYGLSKWTDPYMALAHVFKILEKQDFTIEDVMVAYDRKNEVNFERLKDIY